MKFSEEVRIIVNNIRNKLIKLHGRLIDMAKPFDNIYG